MVDSPFKRLCDEGVANAITISNPRDLLVDPHRMRRIRLLHDRAAIIVVRYHRDESHCFRDFGPSLGDSNQWVRRELASDKRDMVQLE